MGSALHFHSDEDQESVDLQNLITEKGVDKAFSEVSGLEPDHKLTKAVMEAYQNIK